MNHMLDNKIIVVTGGKGLLGRTFVQDIREKGGTVIIFDNNLTTNIELDEIACDITDSLSIQQSIDLVVKKYGRIDGWVNNAYPRTEDWGRKSFDEESMESFATNVDWHLVGYIKCCQAALNQMKTQGYGSLINMASIYGVNGPDFTVYNGTTMLNEGAYAAIKGGLINFTRFLAAFYGPFNLRVNCVSPGGIFDHQNPIFVKNYEDKVPMRRMGNPDDIAPSISFLLSDGAKYITGHNLIVDGGWTAI
jgi:NAD(P)-dependent dehydrogenase (short-subunit alcohol dehydrogenase family)